MAFARRLGREPIAEKAYAAVRRRILDLTFRPGELLSETRLAGEFGLSRTPIREALKRLEGDGLVDVIPQHGTFVSPIRREALMDAQYAREALECALVRDAARLRTDAIAADLENNLERQAEAVAAANYDSLYRLDEGLHQSIAVAAGRPAIWPLIAEIKIHMDRARQLTLRPDHAPNILAQHRAIVDAIRAGSPERAAEAMSGHLRFVVEHFDEFISANPEYVVDVARRAID